VCVLLPLLFLNPSLPPHYKAKKDDDDEFEHYYYQQGQAQDDP